MQIKTHQINLQSLNKDSERLKCLVYTSHFAIAFTWTTISFCIMPVHLAWIYLTYLNIAFTKTYGSYYSISSPCNCLNLGMSFELLNKIPKCNHPIMTHTNWNNDSLYVFRVHMPVCACKHISTCVCKWACVCMCKPTNTSIFMLANACAYISKYINIYIITHIHTCMYPNAHTNIYTIYDMLASKQIWYKWISQVIFRNNKFFVSFSKLIFLRTRLTKILYTHMKIKKRIRRAKSQKTEIVCQANLD